MRRIDWETPLSEDDELWLRSTGILGIGDRIARNRERFSGGVVEGTDNGAGQSPPPGPVEEDDDYDDWSLTELREEAVKRGIEGQTKAKKAEVISALRAYDAEHTGE